MEEGLGFTRPRRIASCTALALVTTFALPGCSVANTVKSELASCAEPVGEESSGSGSLIKAEEVNDGVV